MSQMEFDGDLGYDTSANKGIWGGLLATRSMNCEAGGDPVEEAILGIRLEHDFDVFQLASPYTHQSTLSMMTFVANGADYHKVTDDIRRSSTNAVNEDFDAATVSTITEKDNVKDFLKTVIRHSMNIMESVQGFAGGQVVQACQGYSFSKTSDRFMAQLNVNRMLSRIKTDEIQMNGMNYCIYHSHHVQSIKLYLKIKM